MLYDPKWEGEWSLPRFIAFVESKPPGECYDFTQPSKCALAQFRAVYGHFPISLSCNEIPEPFLEVLSPPEMMSDEDWDKRHTWGELAKRIRVVAAKATAFA